VGRPLVTLFYAVRQAISAYHWTRHSYVIGCHGDAVQSMMAERYTDHGLTSHEKGLMNL